MFSTTPLSVIDPSSIIGSSGSCGPSDRAACTAACTCYRVFPYSGPDYASPPNLYVETLPHNVLMVNFCYLKITRFIAFC